MTPYQLKQAQTSVKIFRRKILNTAPCDRKATEDAITELRRVSAEGSLSNSTQAPIFVWVKSPLEFVGLLKDATRTDSIAKYSYGRKELLSEKIRRLFSNSQTVLETRTNELWPLSRTLDFGNRIAAVIDPTRCLSEIVEGKVVALPLSRELLRSEVGQFEIDRIWADYFLEEQLNVELLKGHKDRGYKLSQKLLNVATSCAFWWNHQSAVFVCERPTGIHVDDRGRLHSTKGPAVEFADGFKVYAVCGIEMKSEIFQDGAYQLTCEMISQTRNTEVRRVLTEMYGQEKYLKETGARVIHEGRDGRKLWIRNHANDELDGIPLVMVELINSTPEPDGTHKHYFLRVAPHIRNADEAVASTFRMGSEDYDPRIET